jgi:hypothetical protein
MHQQMNAREYVHMLGEVCLGWNAEASEYFLPIIGGLWQHTNTSTINESIEKAYKQAITQSIWETLNSRSEPQEQEQEGYISVESRRISNLQAVARMIGQYESLRALSPDARDKALVSQSLEHGGATFALTRFEESKEAYEMLREIIKKHERHMPDHKQWQVLEAVAQSISHKGATSIEEALRTASTTNLQESMRQIYANL